MGTYRRDYDVNLKNAANLPASSGIQIYRATLRCRSFAGIYFGFR